MGKRRGSRRGRGKLDCEFTQCRSMWVGFPYWPRSRRDDVGSGIEAGTKLVGRDSAKDQRYRGGPSELLPRTMRNVLPIGMRLFLAPREAVDEVDWPRPLRPRHSPVALGRFLGILESARLDYCFFPLAHVYRAPVQTNTHTHRYTDTRTVTVNYSSPTREMVRFPCQEEGSGLLDDDEICGKLAIESASRLPICKCNPQPSRCPGSRRWRWRWRSRHKSWSGAIAAVKWGRLELEPRSTGRCILPPILGRGPQTWVSTSEATMYLGFVSGQGCQHH